MATSLKPREVVQARHLTSGSFNLASVIKVANSSGQEHGHGWQNRTLDEVLDGLRSRLNVISVATGSLETDVAANEAAIDKIELKVGLAANGDLAWSDSCEYIGSQSTVHSASIVLDARVDELQAKVGLGYSGGFVLPSWSSTNMLRNGQEASVIAGINRLDEMAAPLASPALTGNPTAPTQSPGDDSTKIATTAFVRKEVSGSVSDILNGAPDALDTLKELGDALGNDANYAVTITNALAAKAPLAAPALTGNATSAVTPAVSNDSTAIANTAFVHDVVEDRFGGALDAYGLQSSKNGGSTEFYIKFGDGTVPGNPMLKITKEGSGDFKLEIEEV